MKILVYVDDRQVTDLTVKQRKIKEFADRTGISPSIAEALAAGREFIVEDLSMLKLTNQAAQWS
jgi:hypothetical protein